MDKIERIKEIVRSMLKRDELPKDPLTFPPEERSLRFLLSLLFKPDALPQDPAIVQERKKGALRTLFERESLPQEELPGDSFIPTQEEGAPGMSFLSLLFKPDALSKDPTPLKKKKGLFRIVFGREPLPEDIEES